MGSCNGQGRHSCRDEALSAGYFVSSIAAWIASTIGHVASATITPKTAPSKRESRRASEEKTPSVSVRKLGVNAGLWPLPRKAGADAWKLQSILGDAEVRWRKGCASRERAGRLAGDVGFMDVCAQTSSPAHDKRCGDKIAHS